MEHLGRDGTQQHRAENAVASRRYHDQVDMALAGVVDDFLRGIALDDLLGDSHTA